MPDDPLYHSIVESTQVLTQVLTRLEQTTEYVAQTQRFALRLQTFALILTGVCVVGIGGLLVYGMLTVQEHAGQRHALELATQALTVQTQLLREHLTH